MDSTALGFRSRRESRKDLWLRLITDEDINTIVTPTAPTAIHTGPITRARARQLNYQVLSFLGNDSNVHEIMMLPDEDINTIVTPTAPTATYTGPITRARARRLNYQVFSFLSNDSNVHENMMPPKLNTFVLLANEGPSLDKKDDHWSKIKHGDDGGWHAQGEQEQSYN